MFLKALTLRGFKSFADRTVLDLEPGITVIVGPNGSGKSNVVDALAWVLGTRSPKLLRGGELADVIFAGSPSRPPVGRASVEITIDNSRGQLGGGALGVGGSAQGFSEVRIAREILSTGENVYRINGAECRLLDVQELLSDTGLGRELHTVVGQGQLDAILQARPEDRRAFVEEAAGILKHRRRRERALRKLSSVDGHVERLRTVLRELRRQLRPLERQAEAADQHARLQAELREVRLRLAVHDLARLRASWESERASDADAGQRQHALDAEAATVAARVAELEATVRRDAPLVEHARDTVERLRRLQERLQGTAELVEARRRHLTEHVDEPLAGRPPAELRAQAERVDAQVEERRRSRADAAARLAAAESASRAAQLARREHERELAAMARARAEARERHLRWQGDVDARRAAIAAATAERERAGRTLAQLDERIDTVAAEVDAVQALIRSMDAEEWRLTETLDRAEAALVAAEAQLDVAVAHERELERERASEAARGEALRDAAGAPGDGAGALLSLKGVLGLLADHVRVADGAQAAVAAALGPLGEAVVARTAAHARAAIAHLRDTRAGRALVIAAREPDLPGRAVAAPHGVQPVAELVEPRAARSVAVVAAVREALARTFLAASWEAAVALHEAHPELTFVTRQGDVAGPSGYAGGSAPERSAVLTAAAAEQADRRVAALGRQLSAAGEAVARARDEVAARRAEVEAATAAVNASDARITGAAEELARLNRELEALTGQRDVVVAQGAELADRAARQRQALAALERDPPHVPPDHAGTSDGHAETLESEAEAARRSELEARLAVERLDEQLRHLTSTVAELRREADEVDAALAAAARRRELRRAHVARCGELAEVCAAALAALATSVADAQTRHDQLLAARTERDAVLARTRERLEGLHGDLGELREQRHRAELRRAELRHALDGVERRLRDELGLSADEAHEGHPDAASYDRAALEAAEDTLVRRVGLLGRINPLAVEEFQALEERHRFLSRQLDDLLRSRRDLERVIDAVDEKVRQVFAEAFADVAREFQAVFGAVFPGGEGRLVLTDPEDLLASGIEVEARPPGKRVRRLSLLSGGERSLTALALLFAIFRARPSPFYVLDEVEAALDDVNLQRLLSVISSFKEHAQLLVVTHQKPTMEIADVLYGVTMGSDAVSKVVAERMRQPAGT